DLNPTEWVVMNLETGVYHIDHDTDWFAGQRGRYGTGGFSRTNQMRAPNGRVFFPSVSAWWWHYDPETEIVVDGGKVPGATDSLMYSMKFNVDGSMLYAGTLATTASQRRPLVLTIDPVTLVVTPLCRVG